MCFFVFKQKTAYELRISDWSSDVCSSDLPARKKGRGDAAALDRRIGRWRPGLEAHATHAAHATHVRSAAVAVLLLLGRVGDHGLGRDQQARDRRGIRSEEHTSELQSLMRTSYAVFCLNKKN